MRAILGLLAAAFFLLLYLESRFPLRRPRRALLGRLVLNVLLAGLAFLIAAFLVTPVAETLAGWTSRKSIGLAHLVSLPSPLRMVFEFLLMDLFFYYWHLANHRALFLWRFHNVHHIDPDLDVSTAVRFHFGEIFFSTGFRVVQVTLIGVSTPMYFLYEAVFQGNTLFQHSNVRLPVRIERLLNKVLVTPRMHGIHHSAVRDETNSNYSTIFSWWDRLHRTLRLNVPQSSVIIGVPAYLAPEDNTLRNALAMPFRGQRDYWVYPDGSLAARDPALLGPAVNSMME